VIKVAVIGVGTMGFNHLRVYSEMPDVQVVGIADPNKERLEKAANRFHVKSYQDYKELIKKEEPEAVSVVVPTAQHEEVTIQLLQAGAHVLVEKPITDSLDAGKRLIDQALSVGRKLMVGHIIRFNPAMQVLKAKMQAGELGRVFQIFCRRTGPFPNRIRDVGVVVDLAPHDIDIMRFLTGLEPLRVYAETERQIHTEHEDLLLGMLRFPNGVTGALEINWLTPTKVREVYVLGERGLFRVDDLTQDLYFFENSQANNDLWSPLRNLKGVSEGSMTRYAIQRQEPLKAELAAFIESIKSDKSVPVSGEDGLIALRLALALVESGLTHQVIEV